MRNTLVIRKAMQSAGKTQIWTNKYDNCRTVKCYASGKSAAVELVKKIDEFAVSNNATITGYSIKDNGDNPWNPPYSVIIRVPL